MDKSDKKADNYMLASFIVVFLVFCSLGFIMFLNHYNWNINSKHIKCVILDNQPVNQCLNTCFEYYKIQYQFYLNNVSYVNEQKIFGADIDKKISDQFY